MKIVAKNLNLHYGKFAALQNINFELSEPKIYGLLGRNGAGKTSLLSILASFREATSGSLTIDGEAPFENTHIMQQVAFHYPKDYKDESDHLHKILSDAEKYRPNFDRNYAEHLANRFKLPMKKPIKQFSKGMQAAVNVVVGLASRCPLTIFDEVYLGMDAPSRDIFYHELLEDQERHPRMIILSTHLVSEMEYLFDEVLILDRGRMLLHENYDELINKGVKLIGNAAVVDGFVRDKKIIHVEQLGSTKAITIYGSLSDQEHRKALDLGLDMSPITLHELFVHLTKEDAHS